MRTTVTLDPDVAELLEQAMAERKLPFKRVINDAIRRGLGAEPSVDFAFPTFQMGSMQVEITHALRVAADLEDEALVGKMAEGR